MNIECEKDQEKTKTGEIAKPKSSGNRSFRKHNKLGFYRLIQRKKKKESKTK
jgi:hypothetical protein